MSNGLLSPPLCWAYNGGGTVLYEIARWGFSVDHPRTCSPRPAKSSARLKTRSTTASMVVVEAILARSAVVAAHVPSTRCASLKTLWGRGEGAKPRALLEVFALAMLSRWLAAGTVRSSRTRACRRGPQLADSDAAQVFEDVLARPARNASATSTCSIATTGPTGGSCWRLAEMQPRLGRPWGAQMLGEWPSEGFPFEDRYDLWTRGSRSVEVADYGDGLALQMLSSEAWGSPLRGTATPSRGVGRRGGGS